MVNEINSQPFIDLINFLLKKWVVFCIVGIVSGFVGIIYASHQKTRYESSLTFALDEGENATSTELGVISQLGLDAHVGNEVFAGDNILQILKSRRILESVFLSVDTFENKPYTLAEYFFENEVGNEYDKTVNFPVGISKEQFSYHQDSILYDMVQKMQENYLTASKSPDLRLEIYEVHVTSGNEQFSKIFTERLVEDANKFYIESATKKASQNIEILENRIVQVKNNIGANIATKANTQDNNINPDVAAAQVSALSLQENIKAYSASYSELYKSLEMARFQYLKTRPLIQIVDSVHYPLKAIRLKKTAAAIWFFYIGEFVLMLILLAYKLIGYTRKLPNHFNA
jgi:hypothetical protein